MSGEAAGHAARATPGDEPVMKWIAGSIAAVMAVALVAWLFVGVAGGVDELGRTPEQADCYQPRVALGIGLIAAALFGAAAAVTAMRAAIGVVRGRRHDRRFLWGVPVTLAAATASLS